MIKITVRFATLLYDQLHGPYILEDTPIEYNCDGKEGFICFDGYFRVEDRAPTPEEEAIPIWQRERKWNEWLPKKVYMSVKRTEITLHECELKKDDYRLLEKQEYIIEIYKRVVHESTDRISQIEDDDGTRLNVCFTPTDKQTIYFRVLETMSLDNHSVAETPSLAPQPGPAPDHKS